MQSYVSFHETDIQIIKVLLKVLGVIASDSFHLWQFDMPLFNRFTLFWGGHEWLVLMLWLLKLKNKTTSNFPAKTTTKNTLAAAE